MIKSKTENYGNEVQLLVGRTGYDESGKPIFDTPLEILESLKTIQAEYPNFDITILDVTSERIGVAPRGGYPLMYVCKQHCVWQELRVGVKCDLAFLRDFIREAFPKLEYNPGYFQSRTRTTIFCEDFQRRFIIYNNGKLVRVVYEEFELLDLARKNTIDLYFEKYEINYSGFNKEYPQEMSQIFDWYRNNKNETRLNFIHEDVHRPPQYQEKNFIEEPEFIKEPENIEITIFEEGYSEEVYYDGKLVNFAEKHLINSNSVSRFETNYFRHTQRLYPQKHSVIFDWYEKNKDKDPKAFLEKIKA